MYCPNGSTRKEKRLAWYLRAAHIGPQHLVEISQERYEQLANARKTLVDAGSFEHRNELLLGNLLAFESFCASTSVRANLELEVRYERLADTLLTANRHVVNFLSTTRMFADHIVRDFRHLELPESFKGLAERLLAEAHGTTLGYRFVCELRNHVQHRANAVHSIRSRTNPGSWTEAISVFCLKKRIEEDRGKFKLNVLEQLADEVDLLAMFRDYIGVVSRVQGILRAHVQQACTDAREAIQVAIRDYARAQGEPEERKVIGLTAVREDKGNYADAVLLILEWDEARLGLANKNAFPIAPPKSKT